MKFLKLDYVKAHSRIDYNDEDALLELYINSAEETVMNYIDRTYEEMLKDYDGVPKPVRLAAMMLVDLSYQQRSPISTQNFSAVPYGFEMLLKPYMRLSERDTSHNDNHHEEKHNGKHQHHGIHQRNTEQEGGDTE